MTLIISARTVDGIVLAGDSLATYMSTPQVKGDIEVKCPQCGHEHTTEATLWGSALPSRTLSYAQKVFPFMDAYGVGTFGAGQLNGKTIYFALRELEFDLNYKQQSLLDVEDAAKVIGEELLKQLTEEIKGRGFDINDFSDDWIHVGAQVVGYELMGDPVTYELRVGKTVRTEKYTGLDVTSGMDEVFWALYEIYKANPDSIPLIQHFSLQDAIEYSEFLIKTTALHQQFSRKIPGVGGDIDVAVVTPFDRFKWVKQKALYKKLSEES